MKKTIKKLRLNVESLRTLSPQDLDAINGGLPNDNGSQRCSKIATCQTYVEGCVTGCA